MRQLLYWWLAQSHRWKNDGVRDLDARDRVIYDELRPKLGQFLREFFPSESSCRHCGWPWSLTSKVNRPNLKVGKHGYFAICDECWQWLREQGRKDEIVAYFLEAREMWGWPMTESKLREAVKKALE